MLKHHERLYLQYRPDERGLQQLLAWQAEAATLNPQARVVPEDRIHLTVIHFGIFADVLRELQQAVPTLTWEQYEPAVETFLRASESVLPPQAQAQPESFELFGATHSVLAVRMRPDAGLVRAHQLSLKHLQAFLRACGIEHPVGFMQGSANFRFALKFHPHISLLRSARQRPNIELEQQAPFVLRAMKVHYA